jgi:hypothetical protein
MESIMNSLNHHTLKAASSAFRVEKGIPVPKVIAHQVYPFPIMEVGDSFSIDSNTKVRAAASLFGKRHGSKFATRRDGNGYRVWRVA